MISVGARRYPWFQMKPSASAGGRCLVAGIGHCQNLWAPQIDSSTTYIFYIVSHKSSISLFLSLLQKDNGRKGLHGMLLSKASQNVYYCGGFFPGENSNSKSFSSSRELFIN
jgi:hypothetical protein